MFIPEGTIVSAKAGAAIGLWSIALPNALNFAFSYHAACVLTMLTYIPGESVEYFVC